MNKVVFSISVIFFFLFSCSKDEIEPNEFTPNPKEDVKSTWCADKDVCVYTTDPFYLDGDQVELNIFNKELSHIFFNGISDYGVLTHRVEVLENGQWMEYPYYIIFYWGPTTYAMPFVVNQGEVFSQHYPIKDSGEYRIVFEYFDDLNGIGTEVYSNSFVIN